MREGAPVLGASSPIRRLICSEGEGEDDQKLASGQNRWFRNDVGAVEERLIAQLSQIDISLIRKGGLIKRQTVLGHVVADGVHDCCANVPTHSWQMLCCAWLHDTVEDTGVELQDIEAIFGGEVAMGVMHLTNVSRDAGNRAARFRMNLEKLARAPDWVKTIKVADLMDNTGSIVQHDPNFARLYLREKAATMEILRGADRVLWQMCHEQLGQAMMSLDAGAA